jgi:hypothetical protein
MRVQEALFSGRHVYFLGWTPWRTTHPPNHPSSAPTQTKRVPICSLLNSASICIIIKTWNWSVAEFWGRNWDTDAHARLFAWTWAVQTLPFMYLLHHLLFFFLHVLHTQPSSCTFWLMALSVNPVNPVNPETEIRTPMHTWPTSTHNWLTQTYIASISLKPPWLYHAGTILEVWSESLLHWLDSPCGLDLRACASDFWTCPQIPPFTQFAQKGCQSIGMELRIPMVY